MITIGRYNNEHDVWGVSHNLYHRALISGYEYIDIQANGNNPPTLKQNSAFRIYKEETPTLSTGALGNTVFPPGSTNVTNYVGEACYTPTDQSYTWDTTNCLSTGSNGTYYMYCSGAEDVTSTSLGRAYINYSSSKLPTFYSQYGGVPYSSNGERALCKFTMLSNVLSALEVYNKTDRKYLKTVSTAYVLTQFDEYVINNSTGLTLPNSSECVGKTYNINSKPAILYGTFGNTTAVNISGNFHLCSNSSAWNMFSENSSIEDKTASWTITDNDITRIYTITHGATTKMITALLPTLADNIGKIYEFKIIGNGIFQLDGENAETIDGLAYQYCFSDGDYIKVIGTTTEWKILHHNMNYSTGGYNRSDYTTVKTGNVVVTFDGGAGTFVVGEIVREYNEVGHTTATGRYGTIIAVAATTLTLIFVDGVGTFTNDKYLLGMNSAATAVVDGASKNADSDIIHLTGYNAKEFDIQLWVSTATTFDQNTASLIMVGNQGVGGNISINMVEVNTTSFRIYTGSAGVPYYSTAPADVTLAAQDYSICIYFSRRV